MENPESQDVDSDSQDNYHTWGGLTNKDAVTIAHITDCPTITVHAGKCCARAQLISQHVDARQLNIPT